MTFRRATLIEMHRDQRVHVAPLQVRKPHGAHMPCRGSWRRRSGDAWRYGKDLVDVEVGHDPNALGADDDGSRFDVVVAAGVGSMVTRGPPPAVQASAQSACHGCRGLGRGVQRWGAGPGAPESARQ